MDDCFYEIMLKPCQRVLRYISADLFIKYWIMHLMVLLDVLMSNILDRTESMVL